MPGLWKIVARDEERSCEIEVAEDGGVIFSFRAGDVFEGHQVSVSMSAANEFVDAWI